MVCAWANKSNIVLGQVRVNDKSNEITAIPKFLETLLIEGNIITIDAMGTQTNIANKIIENKVDYILAVKGNRKELLNEIKDEFRFSKTIETDTNMDIGHGRIETRKCSVISKFQFIENKLHWTLDVAFSEDVSRKRSKNTAQNYSILLKIALNLLKNEKTTKQGVAGKRLKAGWNNEYLLTVLNIKV